MKNHAVLTVSIIALLVLVGCGKFPSIPIDQPSAQWESIQIDTVTNNVEEYMRLTLENVPGIKEEYAKAKTMLTSKFASEFTEPSFVPTSYCIQNNPEDVKVESVSFNDEWNRAEVVVYSKYGEEWDETWHFIVVASDGGEWLIDEIVCWYLLND